MSIRLAGIDVLAALGCALVLIAGGAGTRLGELSTANAEPANSWSRAQVEQGYSAVAVDRATAGFEPVTPAILGAYSDPLGPAVHVPATFGPCIDPLGAAPPVPATFGR